MRYNPDINLEIASIFVACQIRTIKFMALTSKIEAE